MFKVADRSRLIVYVYSLRSLSSLKHYGEVKYVSRKMRYVVLFVNQKRVRGVITKLNQLKSVKKIFKSPIFNLSRILMKKTVNELSKEDRES